MYIVVQRLLIHIFPLLFHILQIAEKSESRKVIFEINPLIFRMPIVYLQLVNNVKIMKQVRLLNTKSDACRPSEFIGDYHIHIIVREGSMAFSDRRQITAREIEERHEEKLLMLGPVLERLNDELLRPLIDRTFNIMVRLSQGAWRQGRGAGYSHLLSAAAWTVGAWCGNRVEKNERRNVIHRTKELD